MATTKCTIIGAFDDSATAQRVAEELRQQGFSDVDVTSSSSYASDAARGGAGLSGDRSEDHSGGGITGFFRRLFGADDVQDERTHYAEAVRRGGTVVAVRASEDEQDEITEIMERYDPIDIDQRSAQWRESGYTGHSGYESSTPALTDDEISSERRNYGDLGTQKLTSGEERTIPVAREEIEVDKRTVQRGGVRVYRNVREEPVEEQVNLRDERVTVDRRRADRPATDDDFRAQDEVLEFTETIEEPVVRKQTRVVEEVVIGKETHDRTETVRDTVRRSDVDVEQMGTEGRRFDDDDFRSDYETRYRSEGKSYDTYEPAYRYGYDMASDTRYRGRNWNDVEETIKTDYLRTHPTSTWERARGAVRYGWEKVSNKRP